LLLLYEAKYLHALSINPRYRSYEASA
jgi:hypothetical protein